MTPTTYRRQQPVALHGRLRRQNVRRTRTIKLGRNYKEKETIKFGLNFALVSKIQHPCSVVAREARATFLPPTKQINLQDTMNNRKLHIHTFKWYRACGRPSTNIQLLKEMFYSTLRIF